jgi:hypothetical protein
MIQIYKPTPRVTGTACSFSFNNLDGNFYLNLIKQASWNDQKKIGSFSENAQNPEKKVVVKLSKIEVCGILDSLDNNRTADFFHNSENQKLGIKFSPYIREDKQIGYSLNVIKNSKTQTTQPAISFLIGFTFAEARMVAEYIKFGLSHIFSTERSEEIKKLKNAKTKSIDERKRKDQVEEVEEKTDLSENEEDLW